MIFRSLERVLIRRAFGEFLSEEAPDGVMSELSEWDCFIVRLPQWAKPIFRRRLSDAELEMRLADFKAAESARNNQASNPDQTGKLISTIGHALLRISAKCRLRVKRVVLTLRQSLLICPDQRTSSDRPSMSQTCQIPTSPVDCRVVLGTAFD
jgi:hypothetical protein